MIPASLEGVLCVSRDVVIGSREAADVSVVSREPGVPGERGQLTSPDVSADTVAVRVETSRPVIIGGTIRHLLQLKLVVERVPDVL